MLHFETLEQEFAQLMQMYDIKNVSLMEKKEHALYPNGHKHVFSEQDFDKITISLINEVYALDFQLFHYEEAVGEGDVGAK